MPGSTDRAVEPERCVLCPRLAACPAWTAEGQQAGCPLEASAA